MGSWKLCSATLAPTHSANISSPQSSRVTESKMAASYENVHSRAQNTRALQAKLWVAYLMKEGKYRYPEGAGDFKAKFRHSY